MEDMISVCPINNMKVAAQIHHAGYAAGAYIPTRSHCTAISGKNDRRIKSICDHIERVIFYTTIQQVDFGVFGFNFSGASGAYQVWVDDVAFSRP